MKIAEVVFPIPIDKSFSYSVPEWLEKKVQVGTRVKVPFGSRIITGFVIKVSKCQSVKVSKLKDIIETIDEEPVLSGEMLRLSKWISSYYFCPLGKVLNTVVPMKNRRTSNVERRTSEDITKEKKARESFFIPTEEQKQAIDFIKKYIDEKKFGTALLEGPPRTGKTEVYLQCMAHAIDRGRQSLILLPEISLTSTLTRRFTDIFGAEKVCIFHSRLSRKRHDFEWERIRRGEVNVVIGTRSAIFTQLNRLGLIVIDGEEDTSLKEEKEPRYHARDVALKRARYNNAFVILESSAPSVESHYNSTAGRYRAFKFFTVFKGNGIPEIEIVDRRKDSSGVPRYSIISPPLEKAIGDALESKEKVILFLNRRGFATILLCMECGGGFSCPNCQVPLVLHHASAAGHQRISGDHPPSMVCHYCNYRISAPDVCPNCGGVKLRQFGIGTQRVVDEVKKLFPIARVDRLDADVFDQGNSSQDVLDAFRRGKIDLLVGTRMIPREEIPGVSLLGIISIDTMLNLPDFRSAERAFQVLTRIIGLLQSSKKGNQARVVIQTYNPDHHIFSGLSGWNYQKFYKSEMKMRRTLGYPPFTHLVLLVVSGGNEMNCNRIADRIAQVFREQKEKNNYKLEIFGPAPAPLSKLKGKYRYQILIKSKKKSVLDRCLQSLRDNYIYGSGRGERVSIDVDPVRML